MSERKGTKALELWCKRLVKDCSDVQIDNMTTSWRNGIAFCALVHHFRPDLIDMTKLKPENVYENNKIAFNIAEKHLGIPALLDPEDMVENEVPDRLSILTYLSQFYQRLGHTVTMKPSDNDSHSPGASSLSSSAPFKFGKTGLDKCAVCDLPVYLAQRLIVSHKLYHRRCFRCSKCSGHLNPNNVEFIKESDFTCDSCKSENTLTKFYNNNNDQIGMLAFNDDLPKSSTDAQNDKPTSTKNIRPQSILEKISIFENNVEKESKLENKFNNMSLKDNLDRRINTKLSNNQIDSLDNAPIKEIIKDEVKHPQSEEIEHDIPIEIDEISKPLKTPEKSYKSNVEKINFLNTQLESDTSETIMVDIQEENIKDIEKDCVSIVEEKNIDENDIVLNEDSNITDDKRLFYNNNISNDHDLKKSISDETADVIGKILVPPKRKKRLSSPEKKIVTPEVKKIDPKEYPDHLNPFSDEEDGDEDVKLEGSKSTNPFGSSGDEADDDVPPIHPPPKIPTLHTQVTPTKRLIAANPFWSDGEEPSTDEEIDTKSSMTYKSSITTSTPEIPGSPRHKKGRAPPPPRPTPPSIALSLPATSTDDVASISSMSSYNSTVLSDQKYFGGSTPRLKKKRPAPSPNSLSTLSVAGSLERGIDGSDNRSSTSDGARRGKGPAPGLPLPARREVKLQMSAAAIQEQLDVLETQQLGLERQGVLIERMIRDKCEGDTATSAPQEEVEDLVIQLCELVNEKNDLFRKQTELMYIRRQQRLEQEQADIEHEIRIIQSRPAVNRIDADKAREEQLVSRLVEIVHLRDQLVQQMEAERRRERQEDRAIASSIASKRAQRSSESNSSSIKSVEVAPAPKKNKVKDKVKKQFKKAKHSLIPKKKDESEKKGEKEKKSK